jgi:undecaprenyl-diphosphatase
VLTARFLGIEQTEFVKSFIIVIQLGAILAAIVMYGKTLIKNKFLIQKIIAAFIPSAIIGFLGYRLIKSFLIGNEWVTVISLFIGGILLIVLERRLGEEKGSKYTLKSITLRDAFFIGLGQSLSVIPGVSRAGATIMTGLFIGMNRRSAVEFSFMLAIPTMIAASGYDMLQSEWTFTSENLFTLGLGFVLSFVIALVVMRWLLKFIQTNTFIPFGIYRIVAAIMFALLFLL